MQLGNWVVGWDLLQPSSKFWKSLICPSDTRLHISLFGTKLCLYLHISIYLSEHWLICTDTLTRRSRHLPFPMLPPTWEDTHTELLCSSLVQFNVVSAETSLLLSAVSPSHHLYLSTVWVLVPLSTCLPPYRFSTQVYDCWMYQWSSSGIHVPQGHGGVEDWVKRACALVIG